VERHSLTMAAYLAFQTEIGVNLINKSNTDDCPDSLACRKVKEILDPSKTR
jgi:hypothetical protein